jgi:glutamate-5-semialdehyde dehydrogenase
MTDTIVESAQKAASAGTTDSPDATQDAVLAVARRARAAAAALAPLTRDTKDAALLAMADALEAATERVVAVNLRDLDRARDAGTAAGLVDRLTLNAERIIGIAHGLRQVAALPDPVGEAVSGYRLPNGLGVSQVRVPLGVVGMIYEARPNVTVDAAGLCLKSGNAVLLRGSSSAYDTNRVLVDVLREALAGHGLPVDAVQLVPGTSHDSVQYLMRARGLVDVLIPRGGAALISSVVEASTVPVIETGVGNVHVYVDAAADQTKALDILLNAKVQRPTVCNAAETLLVHADVADEFLAAALPALRDAGVTVHADERVADAGARAGVPTEPVTDDDWAAEYYSLDLAAGVVDSLPEAVEHIRRWSSGHTEAIVSDSVGAVRAFVSGVDSAAVMVNASTRFTDGEQLGLGAEIGISTQKLHARGPMGLAALTSTTWVVAGDGHVRT